MTACTADTEYPLRLWSRGKRWGATERRAILTWAAGVEGRRQRRTHWWVSESTRMGKSMQVRKSSASLPKTCTRTTAGWHCTPSLASSPGMHCPRTPPGPTYPLEVPTHTRHSEGSKPRPTVASLGSRRSGPITQRVATAEPMRFRHHSKDDNSLSAP